MGNRSMLVIVTLACLLVLAGLGAWYLIDSGGRAQEDRPMIPRVQR